jgi:hypothetical protein
MVTQIKMHQVYQEGHQIKCDSLFCAYNFNDVLNFYCQDKNSSRGQACKRNDFCVGFPFFFA